MKIKMIYLMVVGWISIFVMNLWAVGNVGQGIEYASGSNPAGIINYFGTLLLVAYGFGILLNINSKMEINI